MRVLVNRYAAVGPKSGIGHYTEQLLAELRRLQPGQIAAVPGDGVFRALQFASRVRPYVKPAAAPASPLTGNPNWLSRGREWLGGKMRDRLLRYLCAAAARQRCHVYHEPNYLPLPLELPTVITVHDLSVLLHPEWHPADRVRQHEEAFRNIKNRCQHFIAVSEFTRRELIRLLAIAPDCVTRAYNGVRPNMRPLPRQQVLAGLRRLRLSENFLLCVGTIEPRKNVLTLLRAYCSLPARVREKCPLVLAGGWGWNTADVAEFLDREARHRGVVHLGYVADEHLPLLYNGARALLFPSHYEGFGLPAAEMLACGGAVLASSATALVETVGSAACFLPPEDTDGWRTAMARVAQDDDWWQLLRQGACAAARPFTWKQCASDTLLAYQRTLAGAGLPARLAA